MWSALLAAALTANSPAPDAGPAVDAGAPAPAADAGKPAAAPAAKADAGAPPPAPAASALPDLPKGDLIPYARRVEKLPNGLTVVMVPFAANGVVAYQTAVRVGSRNEVEAGRTGYAHFFEHMMFRGTKKTPEALYQGTLQKMGGVANAYTTDDYTLYHQVLPASGLPALIELESDRFQSLLYTQPVFQTESKAVLGEYNKNASNPDEKLDEVLHKTAFSAHTYRHTTIGFVDDIKKMDTGFAYSQTFFKKFYTPDNAIIVVAGDFKPDEVLAEITKAYGGWKGKLADAKPKAEPPQTAEKTAAVEWATPTLPKLAIGYHTPESELKTKDAAVQMLLGTLLTGPTSALYRDLVLDRQLVDHMEVWYASHRDPNLFTVVFTAKKPEDLPEIQKAFDAQLEAVGKGEIDAKALQALKLNQVYGVKMSMETPEAVGMALGAELGVTGEPDGFEALYRNLADVQVSDISGFAQLYLAKEGRTVVTLRSKAGAK
jgi:zinc protease